jgi:hypothetical protein
MDGALEEKARTSSLGLALASLEMTTIKRVLGHVDMNIRLVCSYYLYHSLAIKMKVGHVCGLVRVSRDTFLVCLGLVAGTKSCQSACGECVASGAVLEKHQT